MRLKQLIKGESGYALPLAMASIVIFSVIFGTYITLLSQEVKTNMDIVNKWQAKYIAESGFDNALYQSKIALQNGRSNYTVDLSTNYFNANGSPKLLPVDTLLLNSKDSAIKSSWSSTNAGGVPVKDKNQVSIGDYKWVIKYDEPTASGQLAGTSPATPQNPQPERLINTLTIESVGTYHYSSGSLNKDIKARIRVVIKEEFLPVLIPDSPVNVTIVSFTEVPSAFNWEL